MTRDEKITLLRRDMKYVVDLIEDIRRRTDALLTGDQDKAVEATMQALTLALRTQRPHLPTEADYDPILAQFETVQDWYVTEIGGKFRTWEDLPAVNQARDLKGLPTFKRDFSRRKR